MINDSLDIKLIDFNISKKGKEIHKEEEPEDWSKSKHKFKYRFLTQVSTPMYAAPEIANRNLYTESVDIWGAGVILYLMVFGFIPIQTKFSESKEYTEDDHQTVIDQISESEEISEEWKDLLTRMLAFDAEKRPNSDECLEHPWLLV